MDQKISQDKAMSSTVTLPVGVVAKPAGPACNMRCRYCYYTDKENLFDEPRTDMSLEMLHRFVQQYISARTWNTIDFVWHGGEALLRPLSFYQHAVELQARYGAGVKISNSLQTNGLLLTDEWCRFLARNHWLVGLSIDGSEDIHNHYRRLRGGGPSYSQVMRAVEMLERHGVEWNAMAAVTDYCAARPQEFYQSLKALGCRFVQFTPVVERTITDGAGSRLASPDEEGRLAYYSVRPKAWGRFLCDVFDQWAASDIGLVFVQLFDATLAALMGEPTGLCTNRPLCSNAAALEHNGDLYACDHYVFPAYRLGNIAETPIAQLMASHKQRQFCEAKYTSLPSECLSCAYLRLCYGECPRNRFSPTATAPRGLNYLCEGYRMFFAHTLPTFQHMALVN